MKRIEKKRKMTEKEKEEKWFDAVYVNDIKTVKSMIEKGVDVNRQSAIGWTALHFTCHWGHIDIAKLLINNEADVNIHDNDRWTPLHVACYHGNIIIAKLLINNGAEVNIQENRYLRTPLHHACLFSHLEIAKLLIGKGANLTAKDNDGNTPSDDLKKKHSQQYEELIQWLAEEYPDKALEVMANDKAQDKGIGL